MEFAGPSFRWQNVMPGLETPLQNPYLDPDHGALVGADTAQPPVLLHRDGKCRRIDAHEALRWHKCSSGRAHAGVPAARQKKRQHRDACCALTPDHSSCRTTGQLCVGFAGVLIEVIAAAHARKWSPRRVPGGIPPTHLAAQDDEEVDQGALL